MVSTVSLLSPAALLVFILEERALERAKSWLKDLRDDLIQREAQMLSAAKEESSQTENRSVAAGLFGYDVTDRDSLERCRSCEEGHRAGNC